MSCEFGDFILKGEDVKWDFNTPDLSFSGEASGHAYWRKDGYGPGGWVDKLPLPLHWFVLSTGTPVSEYIFKDKKSLFSTEKGTGHLHMEKNWGISFPTAWIWA